MEDHTVVARVAVVAMPVPVGRVEVEFDVAGYEAAMFRFEDGVVEVRPRQGIGSAGENYAEADAVLGG